MHNLHLFSKKIKITTPLMMSVFLLSVATVSSELAEPLIKDGDNILFIGNSYTFYHNGLPRHIKDVFKAADEPLTLEADMVTSGGKELSFMYNSTDAVEKIESGNYDVVIIQGGFNDPINQDKHPVFREYVRKFHDVSVENGARPIVWAVWEQKVHQVFWNMWRRIKTVTHEIADSLNMPVVPVGEVWADVRRTGARGYWKVDLDTTDNPYVGSEGFLYQDPVHPTAKAVHMNALIFYSFLTGKSCVGLDYDDANDEYANDELEDTVQARVWNIVKDNLWESNPTAINASRSIPKVSSSNFTSNAILFGGNVRKTIPVPSVPYSLEIYKPNGVLIHKVAGKGDISVPLKIGSGTFVIRLSTQGQTVTRSILLTR